MLKSLKTNKAFISLFTLFFVLVFTSILVQQPPQSTSDFVTISQAQTKKHNNILNIQQIIKNTLITTKTDTDQQNINLKLINYFSKDKLFNYYILDNITKQKLPVNLITLNQISKIIILKPSENITYKKYTITNGITKNLFLCMSYESKNYKTDYCFPKNYNVKVVVPD